MAWEFKAIVGDDGSLAIQTENGEKGFGWGAGTIVAGEIYEMLEEQGMLSK